MHLDQIKVAIAPLQQRLLTHPIYDRMRTVSDVRLFMEHHVFAVWDFMTILKSLQRSLTCTQTVWLPVADPTTCRLINEIVLCEESDEDGAGGYASHFELYLRAMRRCGAKTSEIDRFLGLLRGGTGVIDAVGTVDIAECTRAFVYRTISTAIQGQPCEIAACFAFGRENLLADVFERVATEARGLGDDSLEDFLYYLNRHVEVDGEAHGPMAEQMVAALCGSDQMKWQLVEEAAVRALRSRIAFWDGVLEQIELSTGLEGRTQAPPDPRPRDVDFLASAIQLGWLSGLTTFEIGKQLKMPRDQVEALLGDASQPKTSDRPSLQMDA